MFNKYSDGADVLGLGTNFENHGNSRCIQAAWLEDAC